MRSGGNQALAGHLSLSLSLFLFLFIGKSFAGSCEEFAQQFILAGDQSWRGLVSPARRELMSRRDARLENTSRYPIRSRLGSNKVFADRH